MTGYLARFSARRPWTIVIIWVALAIIGGALAIDGELGPGRQVVDILGPATTTELKLNAGEESSRAERLLEDRLRGPAPINEFVIVQSDSVTVDDPAFRAKVEAVYGGVASLGSDIATPGPNYYQTDPPMRPSSPPTAAPPFPPGHNR